MGITYVNMINIQAANGDSVNQVQDDISTLLRVRHHLPSGVPDDFTVRNLAAIMATAEETTNTITTLLGCIAAISLVVGGIGIMNIMLVSVTERTREIGIRKALGATFNNILLQFLIEAIVIGLTGGLMGSFGWRGRGPCNIHSCRLEHRNIAGLDPVGLWGVGGDRLIFWTLPGAKSGSLRPD